MRYTNRHFTYLLLLTVIGARLCSFGRSHLEQSTSSFKTVFLLGSDICAETENFLRQRDDVAYLRR